MSSGRGFWYKTGWLEATRREMSCPGRTFLGALLALLLLSACTRPGAVPTPSPVSTRSVVPTATSRSSPSPTATPVPSPTPQVEVPPLLAQAEVFLADGDYEHALHLYQEAHERYAGTPAADEAVLQIARVYLEMGRPLSATAVLSPALSLLPQELHHRGDFLLAEALRQSGDCSRAIPYYQRYRQEGTVLEDLVAERLAWCHRALGDHAHAAEEFTRAASGYRLLSDQVWMLEEAARDDLDLAAYDEALARYERVLELARKPWYRATILYQMGEVLQTAGRPDEALDRWQEALASHPDTTAASWAADVLLANGASVDAYQVARAYQAAGRVWDALPWFEEALRQGVAPAAEVRYALARARAWTGDLDGALAELDALSLDDPSDPRPLLERGHLLGESGSVARALEAYHLLVQRFPDAPEAGEALWHAGQLLERQRHDDEAVAEYATLLERFPSHERASEARFRAGLLRYRQGRFYEAAGLWDGETGGGVPRAALWQGLALAQAGQHEDARLAWQEATAGEGYYAARAGELLSTEAGFGEFHEWPTWGDEAAERAEAEEWVAQYWRQPVSTTLPAAVRADPFFTRGQELLALGFPDEAREPFSLVVEHFRYDGPALYSLALFLREHHFHALSVRCASRIVRMAVPEGEDAPVFLLRLLYPTPYADLIVPQAQANGVDPLLFFALVRQESLFDRYALSWAEARGLTQVIPSTGEWIASTLGYSSFRLQDLYRPVVSVRFGTWYLGQQVQTFEGQAIPALAAYNSGPGNALRWAGQAVPVVDMDLFVEAVDFVETRDYIERIYTSYWIYRRLYGDEG